MARSSLKKQDQERPSSSRLAPRMISKLTGIAPKQGDKSKSLYEIGELMRHTLAAPDLRELFPGRCPGNCACCSMAALSWGMPENIC